MNAPLFDDKGIAAGEVELPNLFEGEINEAAVHAAVVAVMNNGRQGTLAKKTKAEVSGGGKKPWRQKGLGRARAGSTRSPLWRGGGMIFAMKPRSFRVHLPKRVKRLALLSALRSTASEGRLLILESIDLKEYKTKRILGLLKGMGIQAGEKCLVVLDAYSDVIYRSARNIPGAEVEVVERLNALSLLRHDKIIFLRAALPKLEESRG